MTTFNYSSKLSIKDHLIEILMYAVMIVVPIVSPFGIRIGTARILGPLPTTIILVLTGLVMLFNLWRRIRKSRKLAAKSCVITVDGDKVTYPVIKKGNVEMHSFTLSEIANSDYDYDEGILTIELSNGSEIELELDFFDGLSQLKEFAEILKK